MGLLRDMVKLVASRAAALLVSSAASIVLARHLSPSDYAAYQYAARNVNVYVNVPLNPLAYWAYRYIAQGERGAGKAYILVTLPLLASSILLALVALGVAGIDPVTGLLLAICTSLAAYHISTRLVSVSVDAGLAAAADVIRGFSYSALVVILWWARALSLGSVALACITAAALSVAVQLSRIYARDSGSSVCRRCIREWIRGLWLPVSRSLASLIRNLDAPVLLAKGYGMVIAAYYALSLPLRLLLDVLSTSFTRAAPFLLSGGEAGSVARSYRVLLTLAALLAGYAIAQPLHIAAIGGVRYIRYAYTLPYLTLVMLAAVMLSSVAAVAEGIDASRASRPGRVLRGITGIVLVFNTLYATLVWLLASMRLDPGELLVAWALLQSGILLAETAAIILLVPRTTSRLLVRRVYAPLAAYTLLASILVRLTTRPLYATSILEHLVLVAKQAWLPVLAYYAILGVIDPEARQVYKRALQLISGRRGRLLGV